MQRLQELIAGSENWLVNRILHYAETYNYSQYSQSPEELRRATTTWLSKALIEVGQIREIYCEDNFANDPLTSHGIYKAQDLKTKGLSFSMIMGIFKYHRQSYIDLIGQADFPEDYKEKSRLYINRFFDRLEIGFSVEWNESAQKSLFEHKEWVQVTLDSIGDAVIATNLAGQVVFMNPVAEALTGYKEADYMGQSIEKVFNIISENDQKLVEIPINRVLREGKVVGLANHTVLISKDGTMRAITDSAAPIKNEGGKVIGVVMVFRDVTDRKKAEEELSESEERYRRLVEFSPEPMVVYNNKIKLVYVNAAAVKLMAAQDKEELLGRPVTDFVHPDYRQDVANRMRQIWQEGEEGPILEEKFIRLDGQTIDVEVAALPISYQGKPAFQLVIRDITERKLAEEMLKQQSAAMKASMDGMAVLDKEGLYIYLNESHAKIYGYESPDKLIGKHWRTLYGEEELKRLEENIMPILSEKGRWRGEAVGMKKDGSSFPQELSLSLIEGGGIVCVARDISERKQAEKAVRHQAYHDPLTDLPNRLLFHDRLTMAFAHAHRNQSALAVLFLDLDNFKNINDMLGHAVGDQLLLGVAGRITGCLREDDTVARLGGDEFTILLPEINYIEDAATVAQKIIDTLRKPWFIKGQEFFITCSIGVAIYPNDGDDSETLMKNADIAMYRSKEQGDNYQMYTSSMNVKALERMKLESSMRQALERKEFIVYYQPQLETSTEKIIGMEALIRWQHPIHGLLLPSDFIPLAEETGLIVPIGEWVLRTACTDNKAWQLAGYPPKRVSVNLSAGQFQQKNLVETVAQILLDTGLEAKWLQLEITESIAMQDVEFTISVLRQLRDMGIQIAIDDFGKGYSSLNYLKSFPIHTLKIDRSFVRDITNNSEDAAIVTTVIFLAENLNLKVIAEGVETKEQLEFLKEKKCGEFQGYLFSKPVPYDVFEKFLIEKIK